VAVTAGYLTDRARADFFRGIDATNVDLKAFIQSFYRTITKGDLQPVLDTLLCPAGVCPDACAAHPESRIGRHRAAGAYIKLLLIE